MQFLQKVIDFVYAFLLVKTPARGEINKVKIICHRGWHDREIIENTLDAFKKAYENNFFGIELDVRWTKDLIPVVHHDKTTKRVFHKDIKISEVTFQQLRKQIPQIPTLDEVVSCFEDRIHYFIELKDTHYTNIKKQKETLQSILSDLEAKENYHFLSLGLKQFELFDCFPRESMVFVATTNTKKISKICLENNYGGITGHYLLLSKRIAHIHRLRKQNIGVGFIKTKKTLYAQINKDIEWIFTDHPWRLTSFFNNNKREKFDTF